MPAKFNLLLILIVVIGLLSLGSLTLSSAAPPKSINYLPIVSNNPTKWLGPYGGYIVSVAYDPSDPQIAYAGTFGSGMYKSLDGGQIWQSINRGLTNLYVNSLAIDPKQPSTLYAGTYHGQVYKSVDGGYTWTWSGTGMQDQAIVYSIAIDPFPAAPNKIYASTRGVSNQCNPPWSGVVYKSNDAGITWTTSLANLGPTQDWIYSLVVDPNQHDTIYAAAHETGAYKSNSEGDIWYTIQNGITDLSGRAISISPDYSQGTTLFYGVWHIDTLYKTQNGGGSWFRPDPGIPWSKVYSMAIDPLHANNVYLATFNRGILKTADGGSTWPYGTLTDDQIYSIAINKLDSSKLMAGTSGDGLFRSTDSGSSWQRSNTGINNAMVTSVVHSPTEAQTIYASLYGAGVYLSANQGKNWGDINAGLTDKFVHSLVMSPTQPGLLYALTNSSGLYLNDLNTSNGWTSIGVGLPLTPSREPAFPADHPFASLDMQEDYATPQEKAIGSSLTSDRLLQMVYAPSDPQIAYMGTGKSGVYKSTNGGNNWQPAGLAGRSITGLAVDLADANLVYAVSSDPYETCTFNGNLQISTDGGTTWGPASLLTNFYSIAASPKLPGVLYAGTISGVYRYQSGIWSSLGPSNQTITSIAFNPTQPGTIYAGTTQGAYYSRDAGLNWNFVDPELNGQVIESISINPFSTNGVYFSTKAHGILLVSFQF